MLKKMTFKGGETVRFGFYWNKGEWEAHIVPKEGGTLPGAADATYLRLPLVAVLVLAPVMGAAYAMFLPFIGFAMVAMYLAGLLKGKFTTTPPAAIAPKPEPEHAEEVLHKKAA